MRVRKVALILPKPPAAFRLVSPRWGNGQILCADCAGSYDSDEVEPVGNTVVNAAMARSSDDLIGRVGPHGDKAAACYECEEEL